MFKKETSDKNLTDKITRLLKFEDDLADELINENRVLSFGDMDVITHNHLLASLYEEYNESLVDSQLRFRYESRPLRLSQQNYY